MTIARVSHSDLVEIPPLYIRADCPEVYVADLLRNRGIEFKRGTGRFTAVPDDMVQPWTMYRDVVTGDLVVRQGEDA